ncbi:ceramidase domain-containing protein [Pseudooceanicola aestuarii]|uniref:ceramidase domain-containing protein n=1 Tax=Pseudooceanicola aestuarii TaxID=2697319 RepID=UPI0013D5EFA2|nr:ceramidase domain-containing protein [Pseudooceanicola aestuarii]
MDWTAQVDGYCERMAPGLWAEPWNAVTNLAFIVAAVIMWRRCRGMPMGQGLAAVLFMIGLGSGLFHTLATRWAGVADVLPILGFVLLYIFAANRDFWRLRVWPALILTVLYIPYTATLAPVFAQVPGIGNSAAYAPLPVLILVYAALLFRRAPELARGLAIGAGLLILSIAARAADGPTCAATAGQGTHFLWHLLNALMLGWMIEVWRRHALQQGQGGAKPVRDH